MAGFIKELKKLEKSKEVNVYVKDLILEFMKRRNFADHIQKNVKELLKRNDFTLLEEFYTFIETDSEADDKKILKVGILEEEEYASHEVGYIYPHTSYDLIGNVTERFVCLSKRLSREIPETTFVCEGAILKCTSRGSVTSLKVMDERREILNNARITTKADNTLSEIDFKKCGKSSCSFSSSGGWQEVSVGSISNDNEQLLNISYIMCHKGSKIIIEEANCVEIGN